MTPSSEADAPLGDLLSLRAEIDRIDDAIHDLLMQRAEVVERVGNSRAKTGTGVALRPGREAAIIRRLLGRHQGKLPQYVLVRLWRELLAGTTTIQRPFVVAVCDGDPARAYTQAAREHFGALTPLRTFPQPAQALAEVASGRASVAVLPLPTEGESAHDAWWVGLIKAEGSDIRVIARLPFWSPRPEGAPPVQAFVAAPIAPDESGDDRTLIGLELEAGTTPPRLDSALGEADLIPRWLILHPDPERGSACALVEARGFVREDDPRLLPLKAQAIRLALLGSYATPIPSEGKAP